MARRVYSDYPSRLQKYKKVGIMCMLLLKGNVVREKLRNLCGKRQTRSLINLQKVAAMVNSVIRNHDSATWNYYFVTLNNDFVPQILFYQCYFVSL